MQSACALLYCHLWHIRLYHIFQHYLINSAIFGKTQLNTKFVFWFSVQHLSETGPILSSSERDTINIYIGIHVKCPLFLSEFSDTWISSTDFRKILRYQISWKSAQWEPSCSMRTSGQTDRLAGKQPEWHDEGNSRFSIFCESAYKPISLSSFQRFKYFFHINL